MAVPIFLGAITECFHLKGIFEHCSIMGTSNKSASELQAGATDGLKSQMRKVHYGKK